MYYIISLCMKYNIMYSHTKFHMLKSEAEFLCPYDEKYISKITYIYLLIFLFVFLITFNLIFYLLIEIMKIVVGRAAAKRVHIPLLSRSMHVHVTPSAQIEILFFYAYIY